MLINIFYKETVSLQCVFIYSFSNKTFTRNCFIFKVCFHIFFCLCTIVKRLSFEPLKFRLIHLKRIYFSLSNCLNVSFHILKLFFLNSDNTCELIQNKLLFNKIKSRNIWNYDITSLCHIIFYFIILQ